MTEHALQIQKKHSPAPIRPLGQVVVVRLAFLWGQIVVMPLGICWGGISVMPQTCMLGPDRCRAADVHVGTGSLSCCWRACWDRIVVMPLMCTLEPDRCHAADVHAGTGSL